MIDEKIDIHLMIERRKGQCGKFVLQKPFFAEVTDTYNRSGLMHLANSLGWGCFEEGYL